MDLVVKRWRRYGKDRLYVSLPDGSEKGRQFGFRDLVTGTDSPEASLTDAERAAFYLALSSWVDGPTPEAPAQAAPESVPVAVSPAALMDLALEQPIVQEPSPQTAPLADAPSPMVAPAVEAPWVDLAQNRAGAAAREQALQRRAEAPVKTTLARVLGVHTDERAWRIGADGEEKVASRLEKMVAKHPGWRVLHAVPVGTRGSDIDHVVLGPAGVFTINTKHHPNAKSFVSGDTVLINGAKTTYVRNSRYEADRTQRLLSEAVGFEVPVQGVVCLVGCIEFKMKRQPRDVHVTTRMRLADWLGAHGPTLAPDAVEAIFDRARRSTTWTG